MGNPSRHSLVLILLRLWTDSLSSEKLRKVQGRVRKRLKLAYFSLQATSRCSSGQLQGSRMFTSLTEVKRASRVCGTRLLQVSWMLWHSKLPFSRVMLSCSTFFSTQISIQISFRLRTLQLMVMTSFLISLMNFSGSVKLLAIFFLISSEMGYFLSFLVVLSSSWWLPSCGGAFFLCCGVMSCSSELDCSMMEERFILQLSFDLLFESAVFYLWAACFFQFLLPADGKVTSGPPFPFLPFSFDDFCEFISIQFPFLPGRSTPETAFILRSGRQRLPSFSFETSLLILLLEREESLAEEFSFFRERLVLMVGLMISEAASVPSEANSTYFTPFLTLFLSRWPMLPNLLPLIVLQISLLSVGPFNSSHSSLFIQQQTLLASSIRQTGGGRRQGRQ